MPGVAMVTRKINLLGMVWTGADRRACAPVVPCMSALPWFFSVFVYLLVSGFRAPGASPIQPPHSGTLSHYHCHITGVDSRPERACDSWRPAGSAQHNHWSTLLRCDGRGRHLPPARHPLGSL